VTVLADALGVNPRYAKLAAPEIAAECVVRARGVEWVVVTGGEPGIYDLSELVAALQGAGFMVAIETSGTARGHLGAGFNWVCVSPKMGMPGGREIDADAMASADEIKHVVGNARDLTVLRQLVHRHGDRINPSVAVCLQPMSMSEKATALCVDACIDNGWRLSVQIHKTIGLP